MFFAVWRRLRGILLYYVTKSHFVVLFDKIALFVSIISCILFLLFAEAARHSLVLFDKITFVTSHGVCVFVCVNMYIDVNG